MKNVFFSFLFLLLSVTSFAQVTTKLVPANHVYIPNGFDDNDNAEIIVSGFLPDSCYTAPKSVYKIEDTKITVTLSAIYNNQAGACSDVIVPFAETVRLGALSAKNYEVTVISANPQRLISKMMVKKSGGIGIDDFSYAYITGVRHAPGNKKVIIDGYSISDCFELQELKVESNGADTYIILPIMKKINDFCPRKMMPVTFEVILPNGLHNKEILLHVRSMQGNSVNSIYYTQVLK